MTDTKKLLERAGRAFDPPTDVMDALVVRRDRKRRNERLQAGVLALILTVAIGWLGISATGSGSVPADPPPDPPNTPLTDVEPVWPQTSLEEVRRAQELADAGDPRYTWQVSPDRYYHPGQNHPIDAEFFARFFDEVIGWEDYLWTEAFAHPHGLESGDVVYVRCALGGKNTLYPDDPEGACAPTIDDRHYETVKISIAQLDRPDTPSGIWAVTGWEMIAPAEQIPPPTDTEIAALLNSFLQARIDGEGAEAFIEFAEGDAFADQRVRAIPLLYATSSGASYERSEFEVRTGPVWPGGGIQLGVRLFAENDETVVEQRFSLRRDETGRIRLVYGFEPTTENGQAVPVEYSFLDGEVTYRAADPLRPSRDGYRARDRLAIIGRLPDDDAPRRVLLFLADPRPIGPGCAEGPAPADAEALARSIRSDPDFEATAPKLATIGGTRALQLDVSLAGGATSCSWSEPEVSGSSPLLLEHAPFGPLNRARLYLLDLPGGSARVLAIATITDDDSFETVLEFAAPIVDSIELHVP